MTSLLDAANGALTEFQHTEVPNRYVRLRPDDDYEARCECTGTADSFEAIIDALPDTEMCWVLCHFPIVEPDGEARVQPLILAWAPPSIRGAVGARMVLGARDIARHFSRPPVQIFLSRRMSGEDIADYLRRSPESA